MRLCGSRVTVQGRVNRKPNRTQDTCNTRAHHLKRPTHQPITKSTIAKHTYFGAVQSEHEEVTKRLRDVACEVCGGDGGFGLIVVVGSRVVVAVEELLGELQIALSEISVQFVFQSSWDCR